MLGHGQDLDVRPDPVGFSTYFGAALGYKRTFGRRVLNVCLWLKADVTDPAAERPLHLQEQTFKVVSPNVRS